MNTSHWSVGLIVMCASWSIVGMCAGAVIAWHWQLNRFEAKHKALIQENEMLKRGLAAVEKAANSD